MARKKDSTSRLLTEAELEIMNVVWNLGAASVRETISALPAGRRVAYTTIATLMKILQNKEFLDSEKVYGVLCYKPRLTRAEYETRSVQHLVQNVFQGAPAALVLRLLEQEHWSPEELEALRQRLRLAGEEQA